MMIQRMLSGKTMLTIASAGLLWSTAVMAQPQPGEEGEGGDRPRRFDPEQMFTRNDANGDGAITADEFRGPEEMFKAVDADGDGKVTKEEMSAMRPPQMGEGGPMGPGWLKEDLGATDEEWEVLEPRIQAVRESQMKLFMGGRGGFGRRGGGQSGPGGPGMGGQNMQMPEADELRTALQNKEAAAEDIQAKLDAYRAARKVVEEQVKTAREELRQIVTPRQEAVLVINGVLD